MRLLLLLLLSLVLLTFPPWTFSDDNLAFVEEATTTSSSSSSPKKKPPEHVSSTINNFTASEGDVIDATWIEDNPFYEDDDDDDDDDYENKVPDQKQTKAHLSKALKKNDQSNHQSSLLKTLQEHRTTITLVLVGFAFRGELWSLLRHVFRRHGKDVSVTDLIKLLLFLDFMRRLSSGDLMDGDMAMGGGRNPILAALVRILPTNPAYIPPIAQHYTFERYVH